MKKFEKYLFFLLLTLTIPIFGQISEYSVKAAYLYNFAKFVEWPEGTFETDVSPILIGVVGEDPFGEALDQAVEGKIIAGRALRIKRFGTFDGTQVAQLRQCQILFIAYSEKGSFPEILKALKGTSVLTVSEIEGFPLVGGIVFFDLDGDRVTLGINLHAARKANLTVNSKLLAVSKIYKSE